jgi:hypothetical protein
MSGRVVRASVRAPGGRPPVAPRRDLHGAAGSSPSRLRRPAPTGPPRRSVRPVRPGRGPPPARSEPARLGAALRPQRGACAPPRGVGPGSFGDLEGALRLVPGEPRGTRVPTRCGRLDPTLARIGRTGHRAGSGPSRAIRAASPARRRRPRRRLEGTSTRASGSSPSRLRRPAPTGPLQRSDRLGSARSRTGAGAVRTGPPRSPAATSAGRLRASSRGPVRVRSGTSKGPFGSSWASLAGPTSGPRSRVDPNRRASTRTRSRGPARDRLERSERRPVAPVSDLDGASSGPPRGPPARRSREPDDPSEGAGSGTRGDLTRAPTRLLTGSVRARSGPGGGPSGGDLDGGSREPPRSRNVARPGNGTRPPQPLAPTIESTPAVARIDGRPGPHRRLPTSLWTPATDPRPADRSSGRRRTSGGGSCPIQLPIRQSMPERIPALDPEPESGPPKSTTTAGRSARRSVRRTRRVPGRGSRARRRRG